MHVSFLSIIVLSIKVTRSVSEQKRSIEVGQKRALLLYLWSGIWLETDRELEILRRAELYLLSIARSVQDYRRWAVVHLAK